MLMIRYIGGIRAPGTMLGCQDWWMWLQIGNEAAKRSFEDREFPNRSLGTRGIYDRSCFPQAEFTTMTDDEAGLHRTLVHFLIESKQEELAAAVLDGEVSARYCDFSLDRYFVDIPPSAYPLIAASQEMQDTVIRAL